MDSRKRRRERKKFNHSRVSKKSAVRFCIFPLVTLVPNSKKRKSKGKGRNVQCEKEIVGERDFNVGRAWSRCLPEYAHDNPNILGRRAATRKALRVKETHDLSKLPQLRRDLSYLFPAEDTKRVGGATRGQKFVRKADGLRIY